MLTNMLEARSLDSTRVFYITLLLTTVVKLALAHFVPITGDEAYFIEWGRHPDYGFYDHPPMVGWFLTAFLAVSDTALWLRLPSVLISTFIGWAIYHIVKDIDARLAVLCAALYLVAPINLLGVLITTDTPLILFSFLSAWCFYLAQRGDDLRWYALAGLMLGAAFFSKFFAGLLGIAYFIYLALFVRRGLRPYLGLLLIVAGTLPFIGLNLWWNYQHCWNNYLFNLQNRAAGGEFSVMTVLGYLALLLYALTPPIAYYLFKQRQAMSKILRQPGAGVFLGVLLIPLALFMLLSLRATIGLHWILSFYPFLFIAIASLLNKDQLRRSMIFMLPFTALHLIAAVALLTAWPMLAKNHEGDYTRLAAVMNPAPLAQALTPYRDDYVFATDSYSFSAVLAQAAKQRVIVFGKGSHHGRQDDLLTDFRILDQKNLLLISRKDDLERYAGFFQRFEMKRLKVDGATYHIAAGVAFDYARYRDEILRPAYESYYRIPAFLPVGACYMKERYFAD
ncbi:MAG: glycosyltransferase family 39 protein [Pseudomonadota bacterium]